MKKLLTLVSAMAVCLSACSTPLQTTTTTTSTTSTSTTSTDNPLSALGSLLGGSSSSDNSTASTLGSALSSVISGLLSTDEISASSLVGTWKYSSPAVCFQSENFLQQAGGSAVAGTIENKLAPYYKKLGVDKLVLTIDSDQNFTMQVGKITTTGTVTIDGTDVYFNFTALGTISLGQIKTYITMTGSSQMSVMFDVTKLLTIVSAVGSKTNNSTISTISSLLGSYDGLCAGFKLTK